MTTTGDCDPDALELRSDYAVLKAVGRGAAASATTMGKIKFLDLFMEGV
jgi:hypothetical protein